MGVLREEKRGDLQLIELSAALILSDSLHGHNSFFLHSWTGKEKNATQAHYAAKNIYLILLKTVSLFSAESSISKASFIITGSLQFLIIASSSSVTDDPNFVLRNLIRIS